MTELRGAPMTPEQTKGAFVRVLREYADRANDNFSQKVAVPEHVLRDAAAAIEDQRAHLDTLTAAVRALPRTAEGQEMEADYWQGVNDALDAVLAILNGETP